MPIFEYTCVKCGHKFEALLKSAQQDLFVTLNDYLDHLLVANALKIIDQCGTYEVAAKADLAEYCKTYGGKATPNNYNRALKVAKKIDSLYHSIAGHSDGGVQILLAKEVGNIAPDDRAVDELVVFVPASCSKNLFDRLSATLGLIAYDPLYL